jgi:CRP-like cAMP-binding protein
MKSTIEKKGELFGWSALVEPKKYSATVKCLKETKVFSLSADKLEQLFKDDPLMGFVFMKRIACLIDNRLSSMRKRLLSSIS